MPHNHANLLLDVPVAFTNPVKEIMETATAIGRGAGFDLDWVPDSLEEAVYEIIISSGGPEMVRAKGVIQRLDLVGTKEAEDLFSVQVSLNLTRDEDWLWDETSSLRPDHWPDTIEAVCLSVLMEPCSPLDYGIEIIGQMTQSSASNHERMAREARIEASLDLGPSS